MSSFPLPSASGISESTRDLIAHFFHCTDNNLTTELADEVFAPGATFQINKRVIQGRENIISWAAGGDRVKVRKHTVNEILACKEHEVFVTGTLFIEMKEGGKADSEFAAKCTVQEVEGRGLRIREWRGWVDYVPFLQIGVFKLENIYPHEE